MRISKFCIANKVGLSRVKILFEFLNFNQAISINTKIDDDSVQFLKQQLKSKEFEDHFALLIQIYKIKRKNFQMILERMKEDDSLSPFEKNIICRELTSSFRLKIKENKDIVYLLAKKEFDDKDFAILKTLYFEFQTLKKQISDRENKIRKDIKQLENELDQFMNPDDDDDKYVENYEANVMRAIANGNGDMYGL